tara:strand:+ start:715 stop:948 length:234 start_codon:yes stop_codon:yes gene_type:complete
MKEVFRIIKAINEGKCLKQDKPITKQSKYKYVYWNINQEKWVGQFSHNGKVVNVGTNGNQYKMFLKVKELRSKLKLK